MNPQHWLTRTLRLGPELSNESSGGSMSRNGEKEPASFTCGVTMLRVGCQGWW
jgi:hypothetical protein